jgi:hypothetical protein
MIHSPVVGDVPILAVVGKSVCSDCEGIANPLDGPGARRPAVNADDVETRRPGRASRTGCKIHLGGLYQFALLAPVDGRGGTRECARGAITNFDEHEAIVVEHHQIDFTVAAAVVAFERLQSPGFEVPANESLDSFA